MDKMTIDDVIAEMKQFELVGCAVAADDCDTPQSAFIELLLPKLEEWREALEACGN